MTERDSIDFTKLISIIKDMENKLSNWTYYNAIRGRSQVAVVYLLFLKYLSDRQSVAKEDNIITLLIKSFNQNKEFSNDLAYAFILEKLSDENEERNVVLQFAQEIKFEKMPMEFLDILNKILRFDFKNECKKKEVVYSLIMIFSSLYDGQTFKDEINHNNMSLILNAAELLSVESDMEIYDFSCGVGNLLAMSAKNGCKIYGQEEDIDKAIIAFILLSMAGVKNPIIEVGDVLQNPMTSHLNGKLFDRIISAPPINDKNISAQKLIRMDYSDEFLFGDSLSESGAWIYARHIIEKLKADGKGILIAPISILSREGITRDDRTRLAERGSIEAIIQLPFGIIASAIRLCIIILRKGQDVYRNGFNILLVDLSSRKGKDYFELNNCKQNFKDINYKKLATFISRKEEIDGISRIVSLTEMNSTEMNFTPAIYLRTISEMIKQRERIVDMLEIQKEFMEQYHETEKELNEALWNYYEGYGDKEDEIDEK